MASHAIFQYNILAIDDTHNTWTNMIVKKTILRLLGWSDDKEKISVARPEGQNELTGAITEKVCGLGFYTGWTDATEVIYVGVLAEEDRGKYLHRLNRRCIGQLHRFSCPERWFLEEREEVTLTG